jgi:hypothetical protein
MSSSAPRPTLLVLLGVVLIAGLFMFMRKGGSDETASTPAPAATQPSAATPAPGSSTTTPAAPAKPPAAGKTPSKDQARTLPGAVKRALDAHKVVVLLFWSPRGVDDRAVKSAVDGLPNHGKVAVFSDDLKQVPRYTKITAGANIVQTPTLVVTNKKGEARVATGYLDPTTVEQYVVDALHGAP